METPLQDIAFYRPGLIGATASPGSTASRWTALLHTHITFPFLIKINNKLHHDNTTKQSNPA